MTNKISERPRIFTIGHSSRSIESIVRLLEASSVRLVADIRSNPASVRHPQFERNKLCFELERQDFSYRWFRELGGRRKESAEDKIHSAIVDPSLKSYASAMNGGSFHQYCVDLFGLSSSTVVALFCAEKDYKRCHRYLLSDKLSLLGAQIVHIVDSDQVEYHELNPNLCVEDESMIYRAKQLELMGS